MENNASERALRPIAVGRNAWLFFGFGDHAQAAANIFSFIASCVLHGLDAESYLADIIRVLPYCLMLRPPTPRRPLASHPPLRWPTLYGPNGTCPLPAESCQAPAVHATASEPHNPELP